METVGSFYDLLFQEDMMPRSRRTAMLHLEQDTVRILQHFLSLYRMIA